MSDDPEVREPDAAAGDDAPRRIGPIAKVAIGVGVVLIGFLAVLASGMGSSERNLSSPLLGKSAPSIEGRTIAGADFSLRSLRGQWVLVNFFATWCAPCQIEHPELVKFSERHDDGTASVVSVAFSDTPQAVAGFFEERGGDWPVLADDTDRVALDYGVVKLPESFIVAPGGTVVAKVAGGVKADEIDDIIAEFSGG